MGAAVAGQEVVGVMFVLVEVEDTIRVPPRDFGAGVYSALEKQVNRVWAGRVVAPHGVCVRLWDWVRKEEDRIVHNDGSSYTTCRFRLLVFSPMPGEVLNTRVLASDKDGVRLELDFFNHIYVVPDALPTPSHFNQQERAWVWEYTSETQLVFEPDANVRCKVKDVQYRDKDDASIQAYLPRMFLYAEMRTEGMGDTSWWEGQDGDE
ncbi:DNA-directed RNA polymerase III subunit rpc8 [Porphyridium purpureum]|uniref:DNA-directed RNA polymerase III subunit rpc8 n=1 Tax=Porphyridium purpureum TaxID=35688 RepID=A0A5J4YZH4_PORPP|nr:DNA-directed RNA polymerase III subunit rpc8 [Porphyridium purpureum]|eukprot:POR1442..scf209_3